MWYVDILTSLLQLGGSTDLCISKEFCSQILMIICASFDGNQH